MEKTLNEEFDCGRNVEGDAVESPVDSASTDDVVPALHEMKTGQNPGPSEGSLE